jgi:hypothetical protein
VLGDTERVPPYGRFVRAGRYSEFDVVMLPDHGAARLHHENVMGGEVATRGTRGTHSESAEANVKAKKWLWTRQGRVAPVLQMRVEMRDLCALFG